MASDRAALESTGAGQGHVLRGGSRRGTVSANRKHRRADGRGGAGELARRGSRSAAARQRISGGASEQTAFVVRPEVKVVGSDV
jgi:hypothetical protein